MTREQIIHEGRLAYRFNRPIVTKLVPNVMAWTGTLILPPSETPGYLVTERCDLWIGDMEWAKAQVSPWQRFKHWLARASR